jgi:hypothetical protein
MKRVLCWLIGHDWCAGHGGGYRCCYRCPARGRL